MWSTIISTPIIWPNLSKRLNIPVLNHHIFKELIALPVSNQENSILVIKKKKCMYLCNYNFFHTLCKTKICIHSK